MCLVRLYWKTIFILIHYLAGGTPPTQFNDVIAPSSSLSLRNQWSTPLQIVIFCEIKVVERKNQFCLAHRMFMYFSQIYSLNMTKRQIQPTSATYREIWILPFSAFRGPENTFFGWFLDGFGHFCHENQPKMVVFLIIKQMKNSSKGQKKL